MFIYFLKIFALHPRLRGNTRGGEVKFIVQNASGTQALDAPRGLSNPPKTKGHMGD